MRTLALVYIIGGVAGMVCGDARPAVRIAHALLWPLGILAFAITLAVLAVASLIAFPWIAVALLAGSIVLWTLR
jgi:hypothetical protein